MKRYWILIGIFLVSGMRVQSARAQENQIEARLIEIEGPVSIHLKDHPEDEFIAAQTNTTIESGDLIRTGDNGKAELALDGKSIVQINSNSDFLVDSLNPEDAKFRLELGTLVAKIDHRLENEKMEFQTPTCVAAIRGTEFGVSQLGPEEPGRVGVFDEGKVAVRSNDQPGETLLGPGQETDVRRGFAPQAARPLRHFIAYRGQIQRVRQRVVTVRRTWRASNPAERQKFRQRLNVKRVVPPAQLQRPKRTNNTNGSGNLKKLNRKKKMWKRNQ